MEKLKAIVKSRKSNKGIGLLELMLALVIIAILTISAMRYYTVAEQSQNVTKTIDMIQVIKSAGRRWLLTHENFTANPLQDFVDRKFLPDDFATSNNPWGGNFTVNSTGQTDLSVALGNVPCKACNSMIAKLGGGMCTPVTENICGFGATILSAND